MFSLENRYKNKFVNDVFKDNILLNISYMSGKVEKASDINWAEVRKPFTYKLQLEPGQIFAYHDIVLPQYVGKIAKTSNANFDKFDGFRSDGYLFGDGICHLASLMGWAAKDAKLEVLAPTRHDFTKIPDVPMQHGVSIYSTSATQNLYIRNNLNKKVAFIFNYKNEKLTISTYTL